MDDDALLTEGLLSSPGLHVPLSTLRASRYREPRLTLGQCGWLDLHCQGLSPFNTSPAYPGAPERRASGAAASGSTANAMRRRQHAMVSPLLANNRRCLMFLRLGELGENVPRASSGSQRPTNGVRNVRCGALGQP
jgi:hypothetical protein